MNANYEKFQKLPDQDRRDVFEAAAERLGTTAQVIEKDVWVCRTIDALFKGLWRQPKLYFKGGTSLSKGFGLINRFSEDIDIVLSRPGLNVKPEADPFHHSMTSNQKRKKAAQAVVDKCGRHVSKTMRANLTRLLPECQIEPDEKDAATLRVRFPSVVPADQYVKEYVKIECGARGADEPHEGATITPYIQRELSAAGASYDLSIPKVTVIVPERTFWEKALILHGKHCAYRDEKKTIEDKNLISRHYYDVAMMLDTPVGARALADLALLDNVRHHKTVVFHTPSDKLIEAIPGTLLLTPQPEIVRALRNDYAQMSNMMFGEAPPFDWVLDRIAAFDALINATTKQALA